MSAPISLFNKLSLESMAPTTRSHAKQRVNAASSRPDDDLPDQGSVVSDEDDGSSDVVRSPTTKLRYDISQLPDATRSRVGEAFREPPRMALHHCRLRDGVYAFQMTEKVPRSIRIRAPRSGKPAVPRCSCRAESTLGAGNDDSGSESGSDDQLPCQHLVWLLDQLANETTLYDREPDTKLTLNAHGYAQEIGDPFQEISEFHLDLLADSLHCVVLPDPLPTESAVGGESDDDIDEDEEDEEEGSIPSPRRVLEARELLSAVAKVKEEEWRSDLSGPSSQSSRIPGRPRKRTGVIRPRDLEATIFQMLLENDEFFNYFLHQLPPNAQARDPYRKLSQRVDRVLADLEAYSATLIPSSSTPETAGLGSVQPCETPSGSLGGNETPRDVAWAAAHLLGIVRFIDTTIHKRNRPLEAWEAESAARALVHMLKAVVLRNKNFHPGTAPADRNLYARLIGDATPSQSTVGDFTIAQLDLIPQAASAFIDELVEVQGHIGIHGAPARFVEKLKTLLHHCRSSNSRRGSTAVGVAASSRGSKRSSQAEERSVKRMK